jgi:hypothetical protein
LDNHKKLFNKTSGNSVERKEDVHGVTVTVQYTKVEPTRSSRQDNFNDIVSVYESTGFTEETRQ